MTRDRIVVDFPALLGRPIPCLEMKPPTSEYATFLVILPGDLRYNRMPVVVVEPADWPVWLGRGRGPPRP